MKASKIVSLSILLSAVLASRNFVSAESLAIHDYHGIKYVTGGVGQDEREYLKSVQHQFNLRLMFAARSGEFLSSVHVLVHDGRGGTTLDAVADGPYLYGALPPGSYTVTATVNQMSQQKKVNLASGRVTQADFYWK
jgi:hypothetical protein